MAHSLVGERPAAALSSRPALRGVFGWWKRLNHARAQRLAFAALLEMDDIRLNDIGISRADLYAAIEARSGTSSLAVRRERNARGWSPIL